MMVRDVSIEAYRKIKANGLLKNKMLQAYEVFYNHGPLTSLRANDIFCHINEQRSNLNQFRATMTHLQDAGVLRMVGTVVSPETGMKVGEYDVTSGLPVRDKKPTKKEKKAAILFMIEDLVQVIPEESKEELLPPLRELWKAVNNL